MCMWVLVGSRRTMKADNTDVDEGIEFETDQHDADIRVYIDDGEHAATWTVTRHGECLEVRKFYHEAGLTDEIGGADVFEDERTVSEYARDELVAQRSDELEAAREYWSQK